ncbi:hypothetical protein ILUMI_08873 [Ignelater luminosus]|uniref:HYDIN/VesB/CFA65-like Ig-like domain-containing protein n=1 Tax=Ignelater luminosus TaxID=2038154 RepID=A0A8K0D5C0_IGNLU|nr:hypothetical protein ILUMI_08873 [Ignelater luminosus]
MHKAMIVPNFQTPPYLVDFGYVILDTAVHYTVLIFNYGPINADVKPVPIGGKKSGLEESGLAIQFKRTSIHVGDTKELFVIFHPTVENYTKLDYELRFPFYLDVGHGPRIPIEIRAVVTVPTITPKLTVLEFGELRCGDCLKKALVLQNNGHLITEWNAAIQRSNRRKSKNVSLDEIRKKPTFFLKDANGILEPGTGCVLDVYFEPQYEGYVEWNVVINVNQNPSKVVVNLKGTGLKPTLKISTEEIEFEPVLPYVRKCEKYFSVKNVSSFPIEFYFADYDSEIDEEERVINLLMCLYRRSDLYIPPRKAGDKLPRAFIEFYHRVFESLREKLIKIEKEKKRNRTTTVVTKLHR